MAETKTMQVHNNDEEEDRLSLLDDTMLTKNVSPANRFRHHHLRLIQQMAQPSLVEKAHLMRSKSGLQMRSGPHQMGTQQLANKSDAVNRISIVRI